MKAVEKGDKVRLSYKLKLEDGSVFESSETNGPLDFVVGEGAVFGPLEDGVAGMTPGESKVIKVPVDQGYGERKDERIFQMPKTKAPSFYEVGKTVTVYRADGKPISVKIIGENEEAFTIDGNHPLAGHDLTFEITIM
ncbi:MAG TPA: FKBP-type peptidyl-prolyl cis-trans isomerase [Dissulfurispiraceae bacterium]|nr:FKBP-type peptidyl-prolyl cis-trans isomerase [Dissulfurispiraceae bacterium]